MKKKIYGGFSGLIGLIILIGLLATACREDREDESIEVEIERYVNNDLSLILLVNGQNIDTVYKDSTFLVEAYVNLYSKDSGNYYEITLNGETFYKNSFYDSLQQVGIYPITVMSTNGGRTFVDTAEIYVVEYPASNVWLPGLWGDNTDSARFRIGVDTLFFNVSYCPTRPLPFVVFADSVDYDKGEIIFSFEWVELLNYYNQTWYYLAFNNLNYWLDMPGGKQFLFIRYGGNYRDVNGSIADMRGQSFNEDLQCYIISTSFIRKPKNSSE